MKYTISVIVEDKSGALTRVTGLFARRGYNIESLAVGKTDIKGISRITLTVDGDKHVIEQLTKQLYKLIDVIKVINITECEHVNRELVLIKVCFSPTTRTEILQVVEIFRAKIIDLSKDSVIVEATGDVEKSKALENALKPYGILEIARTGKIALIRGGIK